jgi:membrane protease subunit HflC
MKLRRNILTLVTAAIIALILVLYMITFVVREGEVAVLTTFQEVSGVIDTPGLYFRAPWPIQREVKFDARLHTDKDTFEETKTSDGVLLVLWAYYNWRVADAELFYTNFYSRDREETLREAQEALAGIVRDAKDDVFGRYAFADLMPRFRYGETPEVSDAGDAAAPDDESPLIEDGTTRPRQLVVEPKFREIEDAILNGIPDPDDPNGKKMIFDGIKQKALKDYGVEITQVGIMRFELPQQTTEFVFDRMREEREKVAAAIRNSGLAEAEGIKTAANTARDQILEAARAQAEELRALGDKEAAQYYDTFAKNPELHDFLRKLQSLRLIINEGTTIVLGTDATPFDLLQKLPQALLKAVAPTEGGE